MPSAGKFYYGLNFNSEIEFWAKNTQNLQVQEGGDRQTDSATGASEKFQETLLEIKGMYGQI